MFGVIICTQILNMEFIQTNNKSELLVFERSGYTGQRQLTNGASSRRLYYKMQWQSKDTQSSYHSS